MFSFQPASCCVLVKPSWYDALASLSSVRRCSTPNRPSGVPISSTERLGGLCLPRRGRRSAEVTGQGTEMYIEQRGCEGRCGRKRLWDRGRHWHQCGQRGCETPAKLPRMYVPAHLMHVEGRKYSLRYLLLQVGLLVTDSVRIVDSCSPTLLPSHALVFGGTNPKAVEMPLEGTLLQPAAPPRKSASCLRRGVRGRFRAIAAPRAPSLVCVDGRRRRVRRRV